MVDIRLEHVRHALTLPNFDVEAARRRMRPYAYGRSVYSTPAPPRAVRLAGVLILVYPSSPDAVLNLVLMKRAIIEGDRHSGQVCFPGGSHEAHETLVQTALREADEELGIPPDSVEVLGRLHHFYTRSVTFEIHPTVGYTSFRPVWRPQPTEVADVLEMPLQALLDDTLKMEEEWEKDGYKLRVPFYHWHGEPVWGATGMMLSEFEWRLRTVLGLDEA